MKSYVVRIYRCERAKNGKLVGIVEGTDRQERLAFTCMDDLWEILNNPGDGPASTDGPEGTHGSRRRQKRIGP